MSETGSLDRMKAAVERRKKGLDDSVTTVSERVEGTRVNPDSLISELLANTELLESGESMFDRKLQKLWIFKMINVELLLMALSAWHYSDGTATVHFERRHDIIGRSRGEKHGWISIQKSCDGKSEIVACTRQQLLHSPYTSSAISLLINNKNRNDLIDMIEIDIRTKTEIMWNCVCFTFDVVSEWNCLFEGIGNRIFSDSNAFDHRWPAPMHAQAQIARVRKQEILEDIHGSADSLATCECVESASDRRMPLCASGTW